MRIVTSGIGLRAGHVLTTLKAEMPEAEIVGYYDPQPTHLDMIGDRHPALPLGRGDAVGRQARPLLRLLAQCLPPRPDPAGA